VQPRLAHLARWATALALGAATFAGPAGAAQLKPEAAAAFERYVRQAESRVQAQMAAPHGFLFATTEERRSSLRAGAVLTEPKLPRGELKVPSGLIHDWAGAVFIPGISIGRVLEFLQAYDHHKEFFQPEVIDSRILERTGNDFRVALRLLKKKVLTVVLDTEHAAHYERVSETRWWSRSRSTRIAEIQNPGTPSERALPPDTGNGFLWRLNSYWTIQERDGGTYVECEAISLTRDVPRGARWLIEPIVRTLPRESLADTLRVTRARLAR
jgi:hypothetical protein